jgi:hypothetical protein
MLVDASVAVEVCIGASDHFGCTIAAIIERPSHLPRFWAGRRACVGEDALGADGAWNAA